jgi:hypothetical protein
MAFSILDAQCHLQPKTNPGMVIAEATAIPRRNIPGQK